MLELRNIRKRYGDVRALNGVSFSVSPGRLVGFLGPNGAGKTTAMRAIFGLVALDDGDVIWNGNEIGPDERLQFGYMPEQRGLYPGMRIGDQLTYLARLHGVETKAARAASEAMLDELGLTDRIDDKLEKLSHGNQQRVQLAASLVHAPELLVLDEPFSGLDPIGVASMEEVLRRRAAAGAAVLFSSHQLDLVENLCDDVVIIDEGDLALSGTLEDVRSRAQRRRLGVSFDRDADWRPDLDGIDVVAQNNGTIELMVDSGVDLQAILDSASAFGAVTSFRYVPPTLSEIFREVVGI